ncbi:hypothetical protein, partial [Burkholderia diffusa]
LNRYFFLAFAWHKSGSLAVSLCLTHKRLDRLTIQGKSVFAKMCAALVPRLDRQRSIRLEIDQKRTRAMFIPSTESA